MTDDQSPKKRSKLARYGCFVLIAAAILLLALPTMFAIWSIRASGRLREELARIEAAGEPVTPEDLAAMYDDSSADADVGKAWLVALRPLEGGAFDTATGELPIVGDSEKEIPPPGQPWEDLDAVEEFLKKYEVSLQRLHKAAELDAPARYPIDFREGYSMRLEERNLLRRASRLLKLQAHARAHGGDAHGTARAIHAIFRVAASLEQEPIFVSQLIGMSCHHSAILPLEQLLPYVEFSDEDWELVQADLRAPDFKRSVRLALLGDRVMGLKEFEGYTKGLALFRDDDLLFHLRHTDRLLAAVEQPWPQARTAVEDADYQLQETVDSSMADVRYGFTTLMQTPGGPIVETACRALARSGMADAAIAVQRYLRMHGELPKKLDQLVPAFLPKVPGDPYDGKPLRYVVRQKEYVVYSIGKNGVDDGGQFDEWSDLDRVFSVTIVDSGVTNREKTPAPVSQQ